MELSKRVPFPVGILAGILTGAMIGAILAIMLATRRQRAGEEGAAKTPSVGELVRFAFAALALIRIANELLSRKNDKA